MTKVFLLTALAMVAFAGNSLLCRQALKQTTIDAATFTFVRIVSGAVCLWIIVQLRKRSVANRELFKPPVSNRYLYDGRDFFVMVIKGPNARNDFHLVDSEEYFYQLKGDIKVRIREGDKIVDHLVREGETFFIPPN